MSNMSYCRFQNTRGDLADCHEALEELNLEGEPLSREELDAAQDLVERCFDIVHFLIETGGLDADVATEEDLRRVVVQMQADAHKREGGKL